MLIPHGINASFTSALFSVLPNINCIPSIPVTITDVTIPTGISMPSKKFEISTSPPWLIAGFLLSSALPRSKKPFAEARKSSFPPAFTVLCIDNNINLVFSSPYHPPK